MLYAIECMEILFNFGNTFQFFLYQQWAFITNENPCLRVSMTPLKRRDKKKQMYNKEFCVALTSTSGNQMENNKNL